MSTFVDNPSGTTPATRGAVEEIAGEGRRRPQDRRKRKTSVGHDESARDAENARQAAENEKQQRRGPLAELETGGRETWPESSRGDASKASKYWELSSRYWNENAMSMVRRKDFFMKKTA